MIKIDRVTLREIRLPLVEPFQSSTGVVDHRRVLLIELTSADGMTSWSECVAESRPSYNPETVDTCWLAIQEWIAPVVLRDSFESAAAIHDALARQVRGHRMARAAVEMGAWAMEAIGRDLPLAKLLAETSHASKADVSPRTHVDTGIALGMHDSPTALADRAVAAMKDGYRRIKLKIAPGHDVDLVRAVATRVGEGAAISVDANGSYTMADASHVAALESLDSLGLSMIEQPLSHNDLVQHADLQRLLKTPICLDESIESDADTETMLALGSARIVNLKPGRVGGLSESLLIHDRCFNAGVPLWCGGMLETGIGRAYNVALASLPGFTEPGDLSPSARYWTRDIVTVPWTMDANGRVAVPLDRPGIGRDIDQDFIDDLTVRRAELVAR